MDDETEALTLRLNALRDEHRELDAAVEALETAKLPDLLQIRRLKKRKLQLKDEMRALSARVLPDIIA